MKRWNFSKAATWSVLCALCLLPLTGCSLLGRTKPEPQVEVRTVRETPPAALLVKQPRPSYVPARPWGELPAYSAGLNVALDGYECQIDRLIEWARGGDPAKVECKPQSSD